MLAATLLASLLLLVVVGCAPEPLGGVAAVVEDNSDPATSTASGVELVLTERDEPPGHRFEALGLNEQALAEFSRLDPARQQAAFSVHVVSDLADPPPVGGEVAIDGDRLTLVPRYPLEPGVRYRLSLASSLTGPGEAALAREFSLPSSDHQPTTTLSAIFPTAERLPENQLKFYLHFSAPMSRGEAYRHLHLLDTTTGLEVDAPFLELGEELWDGNYQRFTLLCDPGRVKRGLKPREELGPVLEEGHRYALVVDAAWRDATRTPLAAGARQEFSVIAPDDVPVDPSTWQIEVPKSGSSQPLAVAFGEPLDRAELERLVWIENDAREKIPGTIAVDQAETRWRFTPNRPWPPGSYRLVAETTLEDLAGNSIGRPFEVDQFDTVDKRVETDTVAVPFDIK